MIELTDVPMLSILFGIVPPILKPLEKCISSQKKIKIFKGEALTKLKEEKNSILYIQSGMLKVSCERTNGTLLDVAFFAEGTIIEQNHVLMCPHVCEPSKIVACENTVVYLLEQSELFKILCENEELMGLYNDFKAVYFHMLTERTLMTSCLDADQRILGWLVKLCKNTVKNDDGSCFIPCVLTQQQISDYLFIHVTTFHRVFSSLKKEQLLKKTRTGFFVKNSHMLEKFLLDIELSKNL